MLLEMRYGCYTWEKKRGGDYLVTSRINIFLVMENIARGTGEISASVLSAAGSDH